MQSCLGPVVSDHGEARNGWWLKKHLYSAWLMSTLRELILKDKVRDETFNSEINCCFIPMIFSSSSCESIRTLSVIAVYFRCALMYSSPDSFYVTGHLETNMERWELKTHRNTLPRSYTGVLIEEFSFECRKTKTKVTILANRKGHTQSRGPIKTRSKYIMCSERSAGKRASASQDWFWFYF